jgi:hypothetical protein
VFTSVDLLAARRRAFLGEHEPTSSISHTFSNLAAAPQSAIKGSAAMTSNREPWVVGATQSSHQRKRFLGLQETDRLMGF